jgi:hypothetical protein
MSKDRRHHPQDIRAKELARAAGLDPYARIEHDGPWRGWPVYRNFMYVAFDEHFARVAVDNIYWKQHDRWDVPWRDGDDCHFTYGRCKSGGRWFWRVGARLPQSYFEEHGYANSEAEAMVAGTEIIKRFAAGRRAIVGVSHGTASYSLKQLNKEKRMARLTAQPSAAKDSNVVEYLYTYEGCNGDMSECCDCNKMSAVDAWNYHIVKFIIVKKTKKRIFYNRRRMHLIERDYERRYSNIQDGIGFVDRQKIEQDGEIWSRKGWQADSHLYLQPPPLPDWRREGKSEPVDLRKLKAEMTAAHPDKGGSNAAFIAARKRYEEARRAARHG